jgi:hypothetical protein
MVTQIRCDGIVYRTPTERKENILHHSASNTRVHCTRKDKV